MWTPVGTKDPAQAKVRREREEGSRADTGGRDLTLESAPWPRRLPCQPNATSSSVRGAIMVREVKGRWRKRGKEGDGNGREGQWPWRRIEDEGW